MQNRLIKVLNYRCFVPAELVNKMLSLNMSRVINSKELKALQTPLKNQEQFEKLQQFLLQESEENNFMKFNKKLVNINDTKEPEIYRYLLNYISSNIDTLVTKVGANQLSHLIIPQLTNYFKKIKDQEYYVRSQQLFMTLLKYSTENERLSYNNFINLISKFDFLNSEFLDENQQPVKKCLDMFRKILQAANEHFDSLLEKNPLYLCNVFNTLLTVEGSQSEFIKQEAENLKSQKEQFYNNIEDSADQIHLESLYLNRFASKKNLPPSTYRLINLLSQKALEKGVDMKKMSFMKFVQNTNRMNKSNALHKVLESQDNDLSFNFYRNLYLNCGQLYTHSKKLQGQMIHKLVSSFIQQHNSQQENDKTFLGGIQLLNMVRVGTQDHNEFRNFIQKLLLQNVDKLSLLNFNYILRVGEFVCNFIPYELPEWDEFMKNFFEICEEKCISNPFKIFFFNAIFTHRLDFLKMHKNRFNKSFQEEVNKIIEQELTNKCQLFLAMKKINLLDLTEDQVAKLNDLNEKQSSNLNNELDEQESLYKEILTQQGKNLVGPYVENFIRHTFLIDVQENQKIMMNLINSTSHSLFNSERLSQSYFRVFISNVMSEYPLMEMVKQDRQTDEQISESLNKIDFQEEYRKGIELKSYLQNVHKELQQ